MTNSPWMLLIGLLLLVGLGVLAVVTFIVLLIGGITS